MNGKSQRFKRLQKEMSVLVRKAKKKFFEGVKEEAIACKNSKGYYKAVKKLSCNDAPEPFNLRLLLPGKTDTEVCEEVATYFNGISDEFEPLDGPVDGPRKDPPEMHRIAAKLRHMKKPKSQVRCDIPPELATQYADLLAIPLHHIFSKVYTDLEWPDLWKRETVTVIPKNSAPSSLSELRNLSCTPLFSKLLEGFLLEDLKAQTSLSEDQYGGYKGQWP